MAGWPPSYAPPLKWCVCVTLYDDGDDGAPGCVSLYAANYPEFGGEMFDDVAAARARFDKLIDIGYEYRGDYSDR